MTILRSCAICVLLLMAAVAASADISGKWKASIETPMGKIDYTYDFAATGTTLTGKVQSSLGTADIIDGKIDGDKVSFAEVMKIEAMEVRVTYSGRVTSADEMAFTRQVGDVATEEFVAKRAK